MRRRITSLGASLMSTLEVMREVPVTEWAGYPLIRAEGSDDPAEWRTKESKEVLVDLRRAWWLPDDWGQDFPGLGVLPAFRGTLPPPERCCCGALGRWRFSCSCRTTSLRGSTGMESEQRKTTIS